MIMVVAQEPFSANLNRYCRLWPLVTVDGIQPDPLEFPNDGHVWWMLTAQTTHLAKPGHLVVCRTEDARNFDTQDPNSSQYQAVLDSVGELSVQDGLNIITIPDDSIDQIKSIITGGFTVSVEYPPTTAVLVEWRGHVYGLFSTVIEEPDQTGGCRVSFTTSLNDMSAFKVSKDVVDEIIADYYVDQDVRIAESKQRSSDSGVLHPITHRLVLGEGYRRIIALNPDRVEMEPVDRKLTRLAKGILNRKRRQELRHILEDLEMSASGSPDYADLLESIDEIRLEADRRDDEISRVTHALLESGILGEERLRKAEEEYAASQIAEKSAEMQARINARVDAQREEVQRLDKERKHLVETLAKDEEEGRARIHAKLADEHRLANEEITNEKDRLKRESDALSRQKQVLQENLEQVTNRMKESGDEIVNQFLSIAPLLGLFSDNQAKAFGAGNPPLSESTEISPTDRPEFQFPGFITRRDPTATQELDEESFFERFQSLVRNSGFTYHPTDLKRFHLSVKSGALTVLGGPSGIGKSSLPLLYSRALSGQEYDSGRPDCLMISVNPSWLEIRDLIGHLNSLDGRYYPSDSGLFQTLICASREFEDHGSETGIYMSCLDEMNLSHVEHYFSDLMMLLERDETHRILRCFSPDLANEDCQFREWCDILLSPALRFIGTVNFDETTRSLSDRFLDRVNLIQLNQGSLAMVTHPDESFASAPGRMVSLQDFNRWNRNASLPPALAALLDEFRPVLNRLGSPISPRVYRGICSYVGASEPILPANMAFDCQIVQRVIPKIRGLSTRSELDALDHWITVLEDSTVCDFGQSLKALNELREAESDLPWGLEDD
jgi:hypothetical protein